MNVAFPVDLNETDLISNLTKDQIDHLSRGIELNFGCHLEPAGLGRYWLRPFPEGGGILMRAGQTVQQVWDKAEVLRAAIDG